MRTCRHVIEIDSAGCYNRETNRCGHPATHVSAGGVPLCSEHALNACYSRGVELIQETPVLKLRVDDEVIVIAHEDEGPRKIVELYDQTATPGGVKLDQPVDGIFRSWNEDALRRVEKPSTDNSHGESATTVLPTAAAPVYEEAMRITLNTTLSQLSLERASLGINYLSLNIEYSPNHGVLAIALADGLPIYGHGSTEAEAIDDCFQQRRKQLADYLQRKSDETHR